MFYLLFKLFNSACQPFNLSFSFFTTAAGALFVNSLLFSLFLATLIIFSKLAISFSNLTFSFPASTAPSKYISTPRPRPRKSRLHSRPDYRFLAVVFLTCLFSPSLGKLFLSRIRNCSSPPPNFGGGRPNFVVSGKNNFPKLSFYFQHFL